MEEQFESASSEGCVNRQPYRHEEINEVYCLIELMKLKDSFNIPVFSPTEMDRFKERAIQLIFN